MEHLHCSCAAIRAQAQKPQENAALTNLSKELRIAIGSGVVGLLFILIIVVIVLCIRHRKVKKRLSQHRMKYLPSPHDEGSAIYQEINDRPQGFHNGKNEGGVPGGYHFLGRAPSLPERYVKPDISRSRNNLHEDEREYLEPLPDSGPGSKGKPTAALANMGYGSPRTLEIREPPYDLARHPLSTSPTDGRPPESDYFDRLELRNAAEEDGGYSTLGRKAVPPNAARDEEDGGEQADGRQYFVLEPEDDVTSDKDVLNVVTSM